MNLIILTLLGFVINFTLAAQPAYSPASQSDEKFDRLDGRGESGKRVDVIEWEGNLEIHVYPKGSLAGLALKIDRRNKDKPVMVIGYRFYPKSKKQLIRRAIISIPLTDDFKVFQNNNEPDFDKIVISNNGLSGDLAEYKLDPPPKKLYPDDGDDEKTFIAEQDQKKAKEESRTPATQFNEIYEDGTIQPFKW